MKQLLTRLSSQWKQLSVWGVAGAGAVFFLSYKLFSLTNNAYSISEVTASQQAQSWHNLYNDPVNIPYNTLVWLGATLGHHSFALNRVVAALFALGAVGLFFYIVRSWMSTRVAFLSTILFICANGFLHTARLGTAAVLQFGILFFFALPIIIHNVSPGWRRRAVYGASAIFATLLYIPGMLWQLLLTLAMRRKRFMRIWQALTLLQKTLLSLALMAVMAPLVWAGVRNWHVFTELLGLPSVMPSLEQVFDNAQTLVSTLVFHSGFSPEYVTHGGALLTIAELLLLTLGVYAQVKPPRHKTNYYLIGATIIATILILVSGSTFLPTLVPLLYLYIAGGIYYFLNEWLTVFPRNQFAKAIGVTVVVLVVVLVSFYHIRSYFVAWPNSKQTKIVYTERQ